MVSIRAMTDHFMFYSMRCNFLATHNSHVCNFRARAFNANFYIRKLINCTFGIDATSQRSRRDSWENYARTCTFHISHSLQLIIDCIFSGRKQSDFYVCLDAWCLAFILAFYPHHRRKTSVYNQYCSRSYAKPKVQFGQSKTRKMWKKSWNKCIPMQSTSIWWMIWNERLKWANV